MYAGQDSIKRNIRTLSRGLMEADYSIAFEGYKNLYEIGLPALPSLKEIILSIDWSTSKKYKELSRYAAGIFSLIHDIDEGEASSIEQTLSRNGCPSYVQSLMKSKCSFSTQNYLRHECCGIDIFEHKDLKKQCEIQKYLESWLKAVPPNDLYEISRVYIVNKEDIAQNASGTYTPGLFKIALLWDNPYKENSLLFKISALMTKRTLFHEIGHHAHRHTPKQHTSDKEKEADKYANKLMKKNHAFLGYLAWLLNKAGFKCERDYYRWGL